MLVEFRFQNFKSFRDVQVLSLVASSDKKTLVNNTVSANAIGKKKLVRSAVLFGPNASGKSNLIEAMRFVEWYVKRSADREPGVEIPIQIFRLDNESRQQPAEFELTFIHEKVRYQYGFSINRKQILREWLLAYPKGLPQTWFERTWNDEKDVFEWYFGSNLKGEKSSITKVTRSGTLFLSTGARFNNDQLSTVYKWFDDHFRVLIGLNVFDFFESLSTELIHNDSKLRSRVQSLLRNADIGITEISTEKQVDLMRGLEVSGDAPKKIRVLMEALSEFTEGVERERVIVRMHHRSSEGKGISFSMKNESLGTRRLLALSGPIFFALRIGSVLAVDELDASLHPEIVKEIISLFHSNRTNPNGAQLIFNTHDTSILDRNLMRRDQVWFTEKDNDGASHLYPLLDYSPRRNEALGKGYLKGRYGAIPVMGDLLEELSPDGA